MNSRPPDNNQSFGLLRGLNGKKDWTNAGFRILSWGLPITLTVAGLMLLRETNEAGSTPGIRPAGKKTTAITRYSDDFRMRPDTQRKQKQSQRPLPRDYSVKLAEQSEVPVRKNLLAQLRTFREMSRKMKSDRDSLNCFFYRSVLDYAERIQLAGDSRAGILDIALFCCPQREKCSFLPSGKKRGLFRMEKPSRNLFRVILSGMNLQIDPHRTGTEQAHPVITAVGDGNVQAVREM